MDKKELKNLESFLIKARMKTYAGEGGHVKPALESSTQLEYKENSWLYRDVYYTGENTFYGMETTFYNNKPVFGMSYYGNWGTMTEQEIDKILRGALVSNSKTRLYEKIEWKKGEFIYKCEPDSNKDIKEISGTETIIKDDKQIYVFYYAGSILIK